MDFDEPNAVNHLIITSTNDNDITISTLTIHSPGTILLPTKPSALMKN